MTYKSTSFKRIALAVVAALGFGFMSSMPAAQATPIGATLTIDSASTKASSITVGDTATATLKSTFTMESAYDSVVVRTSCLTPTGAACNQNGGNQGQVDVDFYWTPTTDSSSGTSVLAYPLSGNTSAAGGVGTAGGAADSKVAFTQNSGDSLVLSHNIAAGVVSFTWSVKFRATTTAAVGVYNLGFYLQGSNNGAAATSANAASKTVTWDVTVGAANTTLSSLQTYMSESSTTQAAYYYDFSGTRGSSESTSVTVATTATDASVGKTAAVIFARGLNSAGESITTGYATSTAGGTNICSSGCALTVTVNGPGVVSATGIAGSTTAWNAAKKSVTWTINNGYGSMTNNVLNSGWLASGAAGETLTVFADGTAGTSTINIYNGITLLKSFTVKFTGAPASATSISLTETSTTYGSSTGKLRAVVKDAAGNVLNAGTVYVYASDTGVVSSGAVSTNATQMTQRAAGLQGIGGNACNYSASVGMFDCAITMGTGTNWDSATATLVIRDSWTVAASTWVSDAVTVTPYGNASAFTLSFDKASYNAGTRAVLTIKATDLKGRTASSSAAGTIILNLAMGNSGQLSENSSVGRAQGAALAGSYTYTPGKVTGTGAYLDSETFVVLMPATSGDLKVTLRVVPNSTVSGLAPVDYVATATVVDPAEVAANAAIAAAKAAEVAAVAAANAAKADAVAAADAATDAALQAIDAANAATDAANLAAEAADAATVAAEEAKDAADAATAAVEALATQVATLMAALQAQVRSLANTVAKIAKKVKA